jgi:hypothetical protein
MQIKAKSKKQVVEGTVRKVTLHRVYFQVKGEAGLRYVAKHNIHTFATPDEEIISKEKAAEITATRIFKQNLVEALLAKRAATTKWVRYKGGQGQVLFKVSLAEAHQNQLTKNTFGEIHEHNINVLPAKSYSDLRIKQALRWASTVVFTYLNHSEVDPREIQAALHGLEVYMSSNTNKANNMLREVSLNKTGILTLSNIYKTVLKEGLIKPYQKPSALVGRNRPARHAAKLNARLLAASVEEGKRTDDYKALREELAKNPLRVPKSKAANENGKHAERRIADTIGSTHLDYKMVGGVKRPCVPCYITLYPGETGVNPGSFWPSKAALLGFPSYLRNAQELADQIDAATPAGTFVSLVVTISGNTGTHDYDTDSDSELSDSELGAASSLTPTMPNLTGRPSKRKLSGEEPSKRPNPKRKQGKVEVEQFLNETPQSESRPSSKRKREKELSALKQTPELTKKRTKKEANILLGNSAEDFDSAELSSQYHEFDFIEADDESSDGEKEKEVTNSNEKGKEKLKYWPKKKAPSRLLDMQSAQAKKAAYDSEEREEEEEYYSEEEEEEGDWESKQAQAKKGR